MKVRLYRVVDDVSTVDYVVTGWAKYPPCAGVPFEIQFSNCDIDGDYSYMNTDEVAEVNGDGTFETVSGDVYSITLIK